MKKVFFAGLLALSTTACTTAGPYVTNISSDGSDGLNIEKCGVKLNAFMGTVSTTDCTSQHIQLIESFYFNATKKYWALTGNSFPL